jgi:hypothetical protein
MNPFIRFSHVNRCSNDQRAMHIYSSVRRQGISDQEMPNLRESLARLVGLIMRLAGGDTSAAFRLILSRCFRMALSRPK